MRATFDVASRSFSVDVGEPQLFGDVLVAAIDRHGNVVPLRGVSFGFSLTVNGNVASEKAWPPEGVRYSKTDQDTLASYRLQWQPEDEVQVDCWLVDAAGERHTATASFTAPPLPPPPPDDEPPQP
jgi:hypothetical protein